jgi:hypothetical protein
MRRFDWISSLRVYTTGPRHLECTWQDFVFHVENEDPVLDKVSASGLTIESVEKTSQQNLLMRRKYTFLMN